MFDRYETGEKAVLVHINFLKLLDQEDVKELELLVHSANAITVSVISGQRNIPHPKYFCGSGKAEEIADFVKTNDIDIVIFNHVLSPSQERNLEALCQCRVIDRNGLILDIFAQRARSYEGKLQVELAQLRYLSTRLIRGWTHLERQNGGIGVRGPGETQLETDRRLLRERIKQIEKKLHKVDKQRNEGRKARKRNDFPIVSLVGYTNAGKSTLFNFLTHDQVYAADQLFATLDATLRKVKFEDVGDVILADTVGFIKHLPHELVAAFKSTLIETQEADLLLHVVDASRELVDDEIGAVETVLKEIKADEVPRLLVYNKIDLVENMSPRIERDEFGRIHSVWISTLHELGMDLLYSAVSEILSKRVISLELLLPASDGKWLAKLHALDVVKQKFYDAKLDKMYLSIRISEKEWAKLLKMSNDELLYFIKS